MEKLVVIARNPVSDMVELVQAIENLPGISVTAHSRSLIDVEAQAPRAVVGLRNYARQHGLAVEDVPEAQLMEPISPFR